MTRMHFEAIAGIIAQTFNNAIESRIDDDERKVLEQTRTILVDNLAMRLAYFNPNFKAGKFIDACHKK